MKRFVQLVIFSVLISVISLAWARLRSKSESKTVSPLRYREGLTRTHTRFFTGSIKTNESFSAGAGAD